ncbi:MAG: hypothetical protein AABO57_13265 [Acidobacteriota bacterium]
MTTMQNDPNPKPKSGGRTKLVVITVGLLALVGPLVLLVWLNSDYSDGTDPTVINPTRPPVSSPQTGRSAASISVGDTKRIRVGNPASRRDMPVFITKEALIRFLRALDQNDSAGMMATLPETFRVDDYTPVRVVDSDSIGNGLYNISILLGPQKGRTGWVLDIDLRD